jgi:hypothetical protein
MPMRAAMAGRRSATPPVDADHGGLAVESVAAQQLEADLA